MGTYLFGFLRRCRHGSRCCCNCKKADSVQAPVPIPNDNLYQCKQDVQDNPWNDKIVQKKQDNIASQNQKKNIYGGWTKQKKSRTKQYVHKEWLYGGTHDTQPNGQWNGL